MPRNASLLSLTVAGSLVVLACSCSSAGMPPSSAAPAAVPAASPTATQPPAPTATPVPALDPQLQASFDQANQAWLQYRLAEARQLLEEIVAQDPAFPAAGRLLGFITLRYDRDYARAIDLFEAAAALPRAEAADYALRGDAYQAQGQLDRAIAAYERGSACLPDDAYLQGCLGGAYLAQGERAQAIAAYERALALDPFASPAGERLHRLYVEDGEYAQAYALWQAANMAVGETALPGDIGQWNALYGQAVESAPVSHAALGRAYATLRLYDEAAVELQRAQEEAPADAGLDHELEEMRTFLRFRDAMAAYLDSFYREQVQAGGATPAAGLGAIYGQVATLFPGLKQPPYSDAWFYEVNDALRERFGVLIRFQPMEGYLSVYLGSIAGMRPRTVSHWGKEYTTQVVWLKDMASRGFMYWYTNGISGTGGWCFEPEEAVLILDGRYAGASTLYRQATDPATRAKALADSRAMDPNLQNQAPLAVFYSPYLATQLTLKAFDAAIARSQGLGSSAEEARAAAILDLADADDAGIMAHEGQHALDEAYLRDSLNTAENQEYRAKMAELVYGGKPFSCLATLMAPFLGAPNFPHGVANAWVFQDIVRQISEHPERYPEVDASRNILLQLPALSEKQIHELAGMAFEVRFPSLY